MDQKLQSIYQVSIVVAVIVLSTEIAGGRPIKSPENKYEFPVHSSNMDPSNEQKRAILPPTAPEIPGAIASSRLANKEAFRPTTPGYSPGVGHSLRPMSGKEVAGIKDDFRPTAPGHSPGIGHGHVGKNAPAEPNA